MFTYIKEHWLVYLVIAVVAIVVGYGASAVLGAKWSTPENLRQERVKAESSDKSAAQALDAESSEEVERLP